ncbi:hypothetical protein AB432_018385 [Brevibacillus brevis]|uniref:Uncharacterized protein n=1 Tax=Brevibacillus brevis TaxID=1393 RepID=A0A2Z4MK74_BREBE|nr:hypothetical protein [Brevibacillus brevis]AWX56892.1 hypothetical protein AB432_018385 [Brevibacillus brevis]
MRADTIDKFKAYFGLGSMIVIVGTMTLAVIDAFIDIKRDLLIAGVGFLGSIIGGAITLIGVRMTIKDQHRREFLNSFSLRYRDGKYVQEKLVDAFNLLVNCMVERQYHSIVLILNHLTMDKHDLLYKAAAISVEAQEAVDSYLMVAEIWYQFILEMDPDWLSNHQEERDKEYDNHFKQMRGYLESFMSEFGVFLRQYHDYK